MKTNKNLDLNNELFQALYKKDSIRAKELLSNPNLKILNITEKHTGYNLLHLSFFDYSLFYKIKSLRPELLEKLDKKNESPLFSFIRRFKGDLSLLKNLITTRQLNIVNNNNENILSLLIFKNNIELVHFSLSKKFNLTDYNYYQLNRLSIDLPIKFYNKKTKHLYSKIKDGNFSSEYIKKLNELNPESFFNDPTKNQKKFFYEEISKNKSIFPHVKLQKMLILSKFKDINKDLLNNYLLEDMPDYGFLNNQEFMIVKDLLGRVYSRISISSFFSLLDDAFYADLKHLEYLRENLAFCKIPKKIKTWESFQEEIKKSIMYERNQKYKSINLNQGINVLNNKKINNDLYIYVPQKQEDLIYTSFVLNMCVGNGTHYMNKIKKFDSLIILLKDIKNNEIQYCIELCTYKYFKIKQAKGNYNKECPQEIVKDTQKIVDSIMGRYLEE